VINIFCVLHCVAVAYHMTSRNGDDEIFGQGFLQDRLAELDGSGDDPFAGPNIEDVD